MSRGRFAQGCHAPCQVFGTNLEPTHCSQCSDVKLGKWTCENSGGVGYNTPHQGVSYAAIIRYDLQAGSRLPLGPAISNSAILDLFTKKSNTELPPGPFRGPSVAPILHVKAIRLELVCNGGFE